MWSNILYYIWKMPWICAAFYAWIYMYMYKLSVKDASIRGGSWYIYVYYNVGVREVTGCLTLYIIPKWQNWCPLPIHLNHHRIICARERSKVVVRTSIGSPQHAQDEMGVGGEYPPHMEENMTSWRPLKVYGYKYQLMEGGGSVRYSKREPT